MSFSQMAQATKSSLKYTVIAECSKSQARTGVMNLTHHAVETPVFMPVGTQGTLKGILPDQLEELGYQIILGNTYHLGIRPGPELLKKVGGLHKFMGWNRALLTDSGGFQMVSLLKLAEITEAGVKFRSPYGARDCMLTPEESIRIQNAIGADIIMQLDDVVETIEAGPRVEEATYRTSRWLDRCLAAHERPDDQAVFPIVQGGTNPDLRSISARMHMEKDVRGFAIGGLSGGEDKRLFWKMVHSCTKILPADKPRYVMGVGFAVDIVVCCALGADMFDCVFPTRTARFGCALTAAGQMNLRQNKYRNDFRPIDSECGCSTCKRHTRAYLYSIVTVQPVACHLLTLHNLYFQMSLMRSIQQSIKEQRFPEFVQDFMNKVYTDGRYPQWITDSLAAVNIKLESKDQT